MSGAGGRLPTLIVCGAPRHDVVQTPCEVRTLDAGIPLHELRSGLANAAALVLLDPFGLPPEFLQGSDWDIPIVVSFPRGGVAGPSFEALEEPLLRRLTFYDRVATADDALWRLLRERFRLGEWQRIDSSDDVEILRVIAGFHSLDASRQDDLAPAADPESYSRSRGEAFAALLPHRVGGSPGQTLRECKAVHRCQARALGPVLEAANELISQKGRLHVLEIGAGVGEWASLLLAQGMDFTGLDTSAACVRVARQNFRGREFMETADLAQIQFPDGKFDLVLSVGALKRNSQDGMRGLVEEAWRVLAPGGWLVFLEEVVRSSPEKGETSPPLGAEDLETLIVEGSGGGAVLEHFEALRYPHDDLHRAALLVCSKVSGLDDPVRLLGLPIRQRDRRPA